MSDERLILDALSLPPHAVSYALSVEVGRRWAGLYVLETEDRDIDVDTFAERAPMEIEVRRAPPPQHGASWAPETGLRLHLEQGQRTLVWEGATFEALTAEWSEGYGRRRRTFLGGPSREAVERFATRIAEVVSEVLEDEVMVFANGCWHRSKELRRAIRGATLENLVLAPGLADGLLADFRRFLGSRAEYERFGVPWKRGALFHGPPGNGKTHCVKALLNELELPCLYVQSFEAPYTNPQANVQAVFERARRTAPCALVLEDLDTLVGGKTRSFFLNELDGFASNTGILTIATTNHPERLDAAILERPSRFDRKYLFGLPGADERLAYMASWNRGARGVQLDDAALAGLAVATDGFSFAYLKELMVSALVAWISADRVRPLAQVAAEQVQALRAQMGSGDDVRDARHLYVEEHGTYGSSDDDDVDED